MPQPLGNEQEILFRKLGLWQEKSSVLNRFNQLETWAQARPFGNRESPKGCKYLIGFRNRDSNQHYFRRETGTASQERFPMAPLPVLLPVGTIDGRLLVAYRGTYICVLGGGQCDLVVFSLC